jgi:hypothetical protein
MHALVCNALADAEREELVTVGSYLDQWIEAHAVKVKPKTLQELSREPSQGYGFDPLARGG